MNSDCLSRAAVDWPASAWMSATNTWAPALAKASAMAAPMPDPAPVTRATFPLSENICAIETRLRRDVSGEMELLFLRGEGSEHFFAMLGSEREFLDNLA